MKKSKRFHGFLVSQELFDDQIIAPNLRAAILRQLADNLLKEFELELGIGLEEYNLNPTEVNEDY